MPHDRTSWDFWTRGAGSRKENRKVDGLQRHTASVTACAWPNCDKSTPETFAANRVGVLCLDHAWSHYDAMNQYLVWRGITDELEAAALIAHLRARQVPLDAYTDEELAEAKAILEEGWDQDRVQQRRPGREWFEPSEQLLQHTRDLVAMHGDPGHYAHNYREPVRLQERRQPMKYAKYR